MTTSLRVAPPSSVLVIGSDGRIAMINEAALKLLGYDEDVLVGRPAAAVYRQADDLVQAFGDTRVRRTSDVVGHEAEWIGHDGEGIPVLMSSSPRLADSGALRAIVCVATDLREQRRREAEQQHAQRLESIGLLASGIAHEINTPMQFIGDNVHFLSGAFRNLLGLVEAYQKLRDAVRDTADAKLIDAIDVIREAEDAADLEWLRERVPRALERSEEGVARVSKIISAMKAFSHPQNERGPVDINKSLQTTLSVAHNEYKYDADVETELGSLPLVMGFGGDLNQVFLNLIVNAAHAIQAANRGTRGVIRVRSYCEDGHAVVAISDSGCGIPEAVRPRIFQAFFTTKPVGKGTGQGLSLARQLVVDKHGGKIGFDSELGRGTTFFVKIPLDAVASGVGSAAPAVAGERAA